MGEGSRWAYCSRFVTSVIPGIELTGLSRIHFSQVLAEATTASLAAHCAVAVSAMVAVGRASHGHSRSDPAAATAESPKSEDSLP